MTLGTRKRVGVGITTYNRQSRLSQTVAAVQENTLTPHLLLVSDDGSTDGTALWLRANKIPSIIAANRGIAWNKNRLLVHLFLLEKCDVVILLEDDTVPQSSGWEHDWIRAASIYGHMNYCGPWIRSLMDGGEGTVSSPYVSGAFSGQCVSFSREAMKKVGFMDTRFKRYGHEHVEHTKRFKRAGFGGNQGSDQYYLIESDLRVYDGGESRFESDLKVNGEIFDEVSRDHSLYRAPFRSLAEQHDLLTELNSARLYSTKRSAYKRMVETSAAIFGRRDLSFS